MILSVQTTQPTIIAAIKAQKGISTHSEIKSRKSSQQSLKLQTTPSEFWKGTHKPFAPSQSIATTIQPKNIIIQITNVAIILFGVFHFWIALSVKNVTGTSINEIAEVVAAIITKK